MAKPKHSKLGASSAYRWWICPGSVALIESAPPQGSSSYALEGSAAHKLAEVCLTEDGQFTEDWLNEVIVINGDEVKVTQNMIEAVNVYLDAVKDDMAEMGLDRCDLKVEQEFHLTEIHELAYGTNDLCLFKPFGLLRIYDYKHGQGVPVEVVNNKQMLIYALGAISKLDVDLDMIQEIELIVVQPRFDHSSGLVRRWRLSVQELMDFKAEYTEHIKLALSKNAPLCSGKHCKFCGAMIICPEIKKAKDEQVAVDFQALETIKAKPLAPEFLSKLLSQVSLVEAQAARIKKYCFEQACRGVKIPGFKLVRKKANRKWIDEELVSMELDQEYGDVIYAPKQILSPAKLEKIVKKKDLAEFIITPDTGDTLVPDSDKRPEKITSAQEDFAEEL